MNKGKVLTWDMGYRNHSTRVAKTAHFSTFGDLSKETEYIWFFLHGYGQLASRSIQKFGFLDANKHFVVAPEGLSRFYWHTNNQPVACWMTREDRYDEIEDYVSYLDGLYDRFASHVDHRVKIVLMGFSQGCATAWRWLHARNRRFHAIVNWAGWIPEDISYHHLSKALESMDLFVCYGQDDPFYKQEVKDQMSQIIHLHEMKVITHVFEGTHKIPDKIFEDFVKEHII